MAAQKKKDKEVITVVAELTVTSLDGSQVVRGFDKAWRVGYKEPVPVNIHFNGFVRKD